MKAVSIADLPVLLLQVDMDQTLCCSLGKRHAVLLLQTATASLLDSVFQTEGLYPDHPTDRSSLGVLEQTLVDYPLSQRGVC